MSTTEQSNSGGALRPNAKRSQQRVGRRPEAARERKLEREAVRLMHDMAAALECGYGAYGPKDHCIEVPENEASRLLARYERWRRERKALDSEPRQSPTVDYPNPR